MEKLFIEDLDIKGKKVLMRVDFNVPLESNLEIADSTRIDESLPSIRYVLEKGGSLILMSHLGRPHSSMDPELSLKPCAKFLEGVLGRPVVMAPDCVGHKVKEIVDKMKPGDVVLLENLRFHRVEEHPEEDSSFGYELASFGDLYVNDAFGSSHRKHTSTYTLPKLFQGKAAAGYLMEKEITFLSETLDHPERPFHALIGGSKISTKIGVLKSLVQRVDALLIGGGMSFTFLKALGKEIGNSLFEEEYFETALEVIKIAQDRNIPLLLPVDLVAAEKISDDAQTIVVDVDQGIRPGYQGLDIGPKTIELFGETLKEAKTILWNGPLGVFELEKFARGTNTMAELIGKSDGVKVVAGGDSVAAVKAADLQGEMTHISTGGGAALEFIEYGTLPGIEALSDKTLVV